MYCKNCGKEIGEGDLFCSQCGTKQVTTYKEVFVRYGLSEQDFIANINKWFQWHPKAGNIACKFDMDTSIGMLANKYTLNRFVIEYELLKGENEYQYGLVKEESLDLMRRDIKGFVGTWQQARPNVKVVNWQGGTHSRGQVSSLAFGGIGASNRMNVYIMFKFLRSTGNNAGKMR